MAINNQIIGGNFTDPQGNPLANGYLVFRLSQDEQSATPGQIASGRAIQVQLDSAGNVPSSPAVYMFANDSLNPANSYYSVSGYTAAGQIVFGPQQQQILSSPSPFNLSAWVPNSITTSSAPSPIPTLETNGVPNGSQTLLNLIAGSGISLTDNGSGGITIGGSGGASGSLSGSISGAHNSPATTAVNLTTEGTYDWAIVSPSGIDGSDYVSNYLRWKANRGMLARNGVRKVVSTPNVTTTAAGGNTGGGWLLTANAGDEFVDGLDNQSGHAIPESNSSAYDGVADISVGQSQTGFGFQFVADASPISRTINIYAGARSGPGTGAITITAHLTDGSAADVVETFNVNVTNTNMWFKVSFTFQSQYSCKLLINMIAATSVTGDLNVYFVGMTES